jgi:hypothetical protein
VHIYDFEKDEEKIIPDQNAQFSPDGRTFVSIDLESRAHVWDADSCTCRATLSMPVDYVLFSPDSRKMVSSSGDAEQGKICLWNTADASLQATLTGGKMAWFSADSSLITTLDGQLLNVWDARTGKLRFKISNERAGGQPIKPLEFAISPDSQSIVVEQDDSLKIVEARTGTVKTTLKVFDAALIENCFSPDGQWIATRTIDSLIRIWKIADGSHQDMRTAISQDMQYPYNRARFLSDGRFQFGGFIRDLQHGTESPQPLKSDARPGEHLDFTSEDYRWNATTQGTTLHLWENGKRIHSFPEFTSSSEPSVFEISRSGERIVAQGSDLSSAVVWKVESGERCRLDVPCARHTCAFFAHFSSDERHLIASWCYGGGIYVFERSRPEGLLGVRVLPEFWLTATFGLAMLWNIIHGLRARLAA